MNKKIKIILVILLLLLLILFSLPYLLIKIELNGEEYIVLTTEDTYQEEGATASFLNQLLNVEIENSIKMNLPGVQKIKYKVKNKLGQIKQKVRTVLIEDRKPPVIILNGEDNLILKEQEEYQEKGVTAIDNIDGDISDKVKIIGEVNSNQVGEYLITYEILDSSNNKSEIKRKVQVIKKESTYLSSYDSIDNTLKSWWPGNKKDHNRPEEGAGSTIEELYTYNAYYMGPDDKTIYLTFDEGSNATYLKEIVEVLNKRNIKGTFFLCHHYIVSNPDVMKLLSSTNHSVGNHTYHHKAMPTLANKENFQEYIEELEKNDEAYYQITSKHMDMIYREPKGEWSNRSLQIVKDLGYKTFFWSASYLDFNKELTKEEALSKMMSQYHNGATYLIHPSNKGNYLALDDFITNMESIGYKFGLVKDI